MPVPGMEKLGGSGVSTVADVMGKMVTLPVMVLIDPVTGEVSMPLVVLGKIGVEDTMGTLEEDTPVTDDKLTVVCSVMVDVIVVSEAVTGEASDDDIVGVLTEPVLLGM